MQFGGNGFELDANEVASFYDGLVDRTSAVSVTACSGANGSASICEAIHKKTGAVSVGANTNCRETGDMVIIHGAKEGDEGKSGHRTPDVPWSAIQGGWAEDSWVDYIRGKVGEDAIPGNKEKRKRNSERRKKREQTKPTIAPVVNAEIGNKLNWVKRR